MTCPKCNKVRRVCWADGCVTEESHSNMSDVTMQDACKKVAEDATIVRTVEKNAIVEYKCVPCKDKIIADLKAQVAEYRKFVSSIADNYDCDSDAHRYGTPCFVCDADKLRSKAKEGV